MKTLLFLWAVLYLSIPVRSEHSMPCHEQPEDTILKDSVNFQPVLSTQNIIQPDFSYSNVKNYIFNHLSYPGEALNADIQGTVIVSFIITKEGKADSIAIIQTVHPLLDNEAIRLIKNMPQWEPVFHSGKPIQLSYKVPVIFEIK